MQITRDELAACGLQVTLFNPLEASNAFKRVTTAHILLKTGNVRIT